MNEQDVFKKIYKDTHSFASIGFRTTHLPTSLFGTFCEAGDGLHRLVTVHASCVVGKERKVQGLRKVLSDFHWLCGLGEGVVRGMDEHEFGWYGKPKSVEDDAAEAKAAAIAAAVAAARTRVAGVDGVH